MESLENEAWLVDDLLDFSSDIGEEDEGGRGGDEKNNSSHKTNKALSSLSKTLNTKEEEEALTTIFNPDKENPFPVFQEEELEWISNQDAFPSIETCDILIEKVIGLPNHHSPVSILLDSSSISSSSSSISSSNGGIMSCSGTPRVPVRARSKRRRRSPSSFSDFAGHKWCFWSEPVKRSGGRISKTTLGRKCLHCLSEKTPQWRAGPLGPKTLCNACGVRYKSGRLMPEYRPASSPTFLSQTHSNSHKKILEMRRQKQKTMLQSLDKGFYTELHEAAE